MTQNALRIASAGVAIAALAVISLSPETPLQLRGSFDPSVPAASAVFAANDARSEGNVEDRTY